MKKKKLKLKVPVSWTMEAMVEVEAYDLAEAVEVAPPAPYVTVEVPVPISGGV